jgi:hypothetical protein
MGRFINFARLILYGQVIWLWDIRLVHMNHVHDYILAISRNSLCCLPMPPEEAHGFLVYREVTTTLFRFSSLSCFILSMVSAAQV